jgi:broad specificity phosphatase PhoE
MGELVLVRHCETEWTLLQRHTSYTDLPLTAYSEDQARAVAPLLAQLRNALVLTSPVQRAVRTAGLACLADAKPDRGLQEWDYGGYEGITAAETHRTMRDWDLWRDGVVPGPAEHPGERLEQVGARADDIGRIAPLLDDTSSGDVVLVGHGHFLRVLAARRLGLPLSAASLFRLDPAAVSRLGHEYGRPVITQWNAAPRNRKARPSEWTSM